MRRGTHKQYKGKYFIIFYNEEDWPIHIFNNVREILEFMKKPLTRQNINLINVELYRALKNEEPYTQFLTGKRMKVYIIDCEDEEE